MPLRYRKLFWLGMLFTVVTSTAFALVSVRPKIGTDSVLESKDSFSSAAQIFSAGSIETPMVPTAALMPTQGSNNERLEAEVIRLLPTGFDPSEISRPPGRFILAVTNRSSAQELDLRLDAEAGNRVHQVRLPRGQLRWKQVIQLPPGNYRLSEASHPGWCLITITAH